VIGGKERGEKERKKGLSALIVFFSQGREKGRKRRKGRRGGGGADVFCYFPLFVGKRGESQGKTVVRKREKEKGEGESAV